jgi:glycosyltransferase involved in cell wall biosynthesis
MRHPDRPRRVTIDGVKVTSLPASRKRSKRWRYAFDYGLFFILVACTLALRHMRRPYDVVQVYSMPDFLVFAAAIPRLLGSQVFVFMNEPAPELAETVFGRGVLPRLLGLVEQRALAFADHAYTVTEQLKSRYIERGADGRRITVVLNSADPQVRFGGWSPSTTSTKREFTVICHGTIEDRYGQDNLVDAVALLREELPDLRLVLTGRGTFTDRILEMIEAYDLGDVVSYLGWVSDERLNDLLHGADVGIVAQKASPYSHLVHTYKMVDYWIFGLPVIASRLHAVSELYGDDVIEYYTPGDVRDLARAIKKLYDDPARRELLSRNGRRAHETNGWMTQRERYLGPYRRFSSNASAPDGVRPDSQRDQREAAYR